MGLPVLSHLGAQPSPRAMLKYSLPLLIDEIAQVFPDLKFIMAHMAHPWQRDCALVLRKHPNVYADVSGGWVRQWQGWEALIGMIEWGVTDKAPFSVLISRYGHRRRGWISLYRLNDQLEGTKLPRIPDDVIEGIIHRDSLALLGLE